MAVETADPTLARIPVRAHRTAVGLAWSLATGFAVLPMLRAVFLVANNAASIVYPAAQDVAGLEPQAVFGGITFVALGIAVVALTIAVHGLQPASPLALGALIAGVTCGIGLALVGSQARAMYSWIAANLAEATSDTGAQAAALWTLNVTGLPVLFLAALGVAAWTILLTIEGTAIGRGWGSAAGVVAVAFAVLAWGLALPAAQYLYVPVFALVAIGLTVTGRRTVRAAPEP